jgi:hypothetical protein
LSLPVVHTGASIRTHCYRPMNEGATIDALLVATHYSR